LGESGNGERKGMMMHKVQRFSYHVSRGRLILAAGVLAMLLAGCKTGDSVNTSSDPKPPPPGGDTTPPTVSITAPANGATVAGTVTVGANATDNVGVVGVQFKLPRRPMAAIRSRPWHAMRPGTPARRPR